MAPHVTSINLEYSSPTLTRRVQLVRKLCIQLWSLPEIPSWSYFCSNLRWVTQSKAFLKSKYITSTADFLSKSRVHCSEELRRFVKLEAMLLRAHNLCNLKNTFHYFRALAVKAHRSEVFRTYTLALCKLAIR